MPTPPADHNRRSLRIPGYDYSEPGAYFLTLCTADRACLFGKIENGVMVLNNLGLIVQRQWEATPSIRREVELDLYSIMPNHFHAILWMRGAAETRAEDSDPASGARRAPLHQPDIDERADRSGSPLGARCAPLQRQPKSLGAMVAGFKSAVTKQFAATCSLPKQQVWQRNYYEHVIRNEAALTAIREYIFTNAERWEWDTYHPSPRGGDLRFGDLIPQL